MSQHRECTRPVFTDTNTVRARAYDPGRRCREPCTYFAPAEVDWREVNRDFTYIVTVVAFKDSGQARTRNTHLTLLSISATTASMAIWMCVATLLSKGADTSHITRLSARFITVARMQLADGVKCSAAAESSLVDVLQGEISPVRCLNPCG